MSGGGKGGSQTTQVQIPEWMSNAAQQNLARADRVAQLDFMPYFGPDVAAMTPMQQAAMQNTNQAALAFGTAAPTDAMAGIPMAQTFAGGLQGYSSAPLYQQSVEALRTAMPGTVAARNAMYIDPITGAQPMYPFGSGAAQPAPQASVGGMAAQAAMSGGGGGGGMSVVPRTGSSGGGKGGGTTSMNTPLSYAPGGVNARNPASLPNTVAARATSGPQKAPTAANRPQARPKGR